MESIPPHLQYNPVSSSIKTKYLWQRGECIPDLCTLSPYQPRLPYINGMLYLGYIQDCYLYLFIWCIQNSYISIDSRVEVISIPPCQSLNRPLINKLPLVVTVRFNYSNLKFFLARLNIALLSM